MDLQVIPDSWAATNLGSIVDYGKTQKCELADIDDVTWVVELEDIEKDTSRIISRGYTPARDFKSSKNIFNKGDILYGKLRPYLNKVVMADENGVCSTEIIPINAEPSAINKYIFYWVKSHHFLAYANDVSYGVNMPRLGTSDGLNAPFILAPFAEQKEIVDRLDILLAQVEATQARLARIPDIIKRFRQSVLAAAVSGKLTEKWRGDSQYDSEGFPSSWSRKGLDDLGALARGKSKHRPRNDPRLFGDKYPFIQTGEVAQSNGVIEIAAKWYSEFGLEQSRLFPKGTLCITIAANIADTAILGIDACFPDSIVGFTPSPAVTSALFVKYLIDVNKNNLEQFAPATAQKNINLKVLKSLSLPYPTIDEQTEIVRRVEQLFAYADTLEQQAKAAKARVDNLTQAILAKAFRGELTADWRAANPDLISGDNSAEALLARIQAERATAKPRKRATKNAAS
ncbi:restriction endonuclease subunit S [Aeromonas schubertii]|uniref:restriction endonuclease subunit S n=1 Tax=Aeromonas schubertii TaxID=652 RepID=UPI0038B44B77